MATKFNYSGGGGGLGGRGTNDLETEKDCIISLKLTECSSICLLHAFGNVLRSWMAEQWSQTIMMMIAFILSYSRPSNRLTAISCLLA